VRDLTETQTTGEAAARGGGGSPHQTFCPLPSQPEVSRGSREFPCVICCWFNLQKGQRSTRVSTGMGDIPP